MEISRARFTKQGKLAQDHNPIIKAPMGVDSSVIDLKGKLLQMHISHKILSI